MSIFKPGIHDKILNISSSDFFEIKIPSISKKENNNKIKNISNYVFNSSKKRNKYSNNYIFTKREIAFNKNIKKNRSFFKYNKCACLLEEFTKNIKKVNKNIRKNKTFNTSLYLTEYINKNKINDDDIYINSSKYNNNTLVFQKEKNNYLNKTNLNNTYIKNNFNVKKNSLFNEYLSYFGEQKKSLNNNKMMNLKFSYQDNFLKELEIKKNIDIKLESEYKLLFKKQHYINNYIKKDMQKKIYIDSFRDFLKEKINVDSLKEKNKIIRENIENEKSFLNYKVKDIKKTYDYFNDIFFVKSYEFIKSLSKKIKDGKIKDGKYMGYISSLKKKITTLKLEIKKHKNEIEALNKFAILNAKIKLKKIILPKYYELVLENKNDELKKYNLTEKEIEMILNYKRNIDFNEMISLVTNYEAQDLYLLNEYSYLKNDIAILNTQKKNFENSLINDKSKEVINERKIELEKLKLKNKELLIDKNKITDALIFNYNKIYEKTNVVLNTLKTYIKYDFDYVKISNADDRMRLLVLNNLSKIEKLSNILFQILKQFEKDNPNKINLFKLLLEKNRKIRKDNEQKKKRELSLSLKKKKLEEKNKKIIFSTKFSKYKYNLLSKNKKHKVKKVIKTENIFDYLNQ